MWVGPGFRLAAQQTFCAGLSTTGIISKKKNYWQNNDEIKSPLVQQLIDVVSEAINCEVLCMAKMKKADVPYKIGGIAILGCKVCFLS